MLRRVSYPHSERFCVVHSWEKVKRQMLDGTYVYTRHLICVDVRCEKKVASGARREWSIERDRAVDGAGGPPYCFRRELIPWMAHDSATTSTMGMFRSRACLAEKSEADRTSAGAVRLLADVLEIAGSVATPIPCCTKGEWAWLI